MVNEIKFYVSQLNHHFLAWDSQYLLFYSASASGLSVSLPGFHPAGHTSPNSSEN